MQTARLFVGLLILAGIGACIQAHAGVIKDANGSLVSLTSIGDALDAADHHPVHILYVHGINQVGAGDSSLLRDSICTKLKLCRESDWKYAGSEYANKGEFAPGAQPPPLEYLGEPIWTGQDQWKAAVPFVAHWVVHLKSHASPLVVDEVNWWPLVLHRHQRGVSGGPKREPASGLFPARQTGSWRRGTLLSLDLA